MLFLRDTPANCIRRAGPTRFTIWGMQRLADLDMAFAE
jgi:hypothetical protein